MTGDANSLFRIEVDCPGQMGWHRRSGLGQSAVFDDCEIPGVPWPGILVQQGCILYDDARESLPAKSFEVRVRIAKASQINSAAKSWCQVRGGDSLAIASDRGPKRFFDASVTFGRLAELGR